jgi:hypothetical protein
VNSYGLALGLLAFLPVSGLVVIVSGLVVILV